PDYRQDINNLSPVQASVVDTAKGIELTELGAPSHILSEFSESRIHLILRCSTNTQTKRKPLTGVRELASMTPQHKRITYIALAKMCMPKLAELFLQFYNLMFFTLMTTGDITVQHCHLESAWKQVSTFSTAIVSWPTGTSHSPSFFSCPTLGESSVQMQ
ncbi:hypothetical protein BGY98DRAFT_929066, partial [Russula aff. rugulosa BPL654]